MSKILTVGNATLDIINMVAHYPAEDEEMRADSQRIECGGNAANTASVLAQYHHEVEFAGTLADDSNGQLIENGLNARHVATRYCHHIKNAKAPTSYIILNQQTGSRTIVHYRDLPELTFQDFQQIPLEKFDWFHFEGRNISAVKQMLTETHRRRVDQPISVEIEKERTNIDSLMPMADVLIFSRVFVMARGFDTATLFFDAMQPQVPTAILVCTWGEQGAWVRAPNGDDYHAAAHAPTEIIDTIGAGDSFNAGLIHGIASGQPLKNALDHACELAGRKVGRSGIDGLIT